MIFSQLRRLWPFRKLPLAWMQLSHERMRLVVAILGVAFADLLMFMQWGFNDALFNSAVCIHRLTRADLVMISRQSEAMFRMKTYSRRELYRALGHPEVRSVHPLYTGIATWKNPWNFTNRGIFVLGIDPEYCPLNLPELPGQLAQLRLPDVCLFDIRSRFEFGPVEERFLAGDSVAAEINQRRIQIAGLVTLGASFSADGNIVTSDLNFLRIFKERQPGGIDVGILQLTDPSRAAEVKRELERMVGPDIRLLTQPEFVVFERTYWETATAIGFIFNLGVMMGFLVGFVIVYQILYTDVTNHLPEYATMKAIGYGDGYLFRVVFTEAVMIAGLGYLPGLALSAWFYNVTATATNLPMEITPTRATQVLLLTMGMCCLSALSAARKLRSADPADVFK